YAIKCAVVLDEAEGYEKLGVVFKETGNIDSSLVYCFKALKIRDSLGNKRTIAGSLSTIGLTYKKAKNYEKGIEYLKKSMVIRKEIKDKVGYAGGCINLANCLKEIKELKEA